MNSGGIFSSLQGLSTHPGSLDIRPFDKVAYLKGKLKMEQAANTRASRGRAKKLRQKIAAQKERQEQNSISNGPSFNFEALPETRIEYQDQPFATGTWAQKMNKMLFLQDFKQLVEKHGFECENAEYMENNKFIMNFLNFLKVSGVEFSENPGEQIIEYTKEEEGVVDNQELFEI